MRKAGGSMTLDLSAPFCAEAQKESARSGGSRRWQNFKMIGRFGR